MKVRSKEVLGLCGGSLHGPLTSLPLFMKQKTILTVGKINWFIIDGELSHWASPCCLLLF